MTLIQRTTKTAFDTNRRIERLIQERDAMLAVKWAAMLAKHPERTQVLRGHRMVGGPFGRWFRLDDTAFSADDKALLRQYNGDGGLAKHGARGVGLLQEFYTPVEIARACVALARRYGWEGGRVLEPSCGPGNFLAALPEGEVDAHELNPVSARVAQILYPNAEVRAGEFECLFVDQKRNRSLKDKLEGLPRYSLVIGNPPFGKYFGRCANMGERQYVGAPSLDTYFLSRSLDLLEPTGLLVFILPASFLQNGQKLNRIKQKIALKAALLDAYRLWNSALYHTEELTDICVFQRRPVQHPEVPLSQWMNDAFLQQQPQKVLGSFTGNGGAWGRAEYSGDIRLLARIPAFAAETAREALRARILARTSSQ